MTVGELISKLKEFDPGMKVVVGDINGSGVDDAKTVNQVSIWENTDEMDICWFGKYEIIHDSNKLAQEMIDRLQVGVSIQ